jgi:hypothetical protein
MLIEIEGYDSIEELTGAVLSDSGSPAICMNEDCDFTSEMVPDQDAGFSEECCTTPMSPPWSLLVSSNNADKFTIAPRRILSGAFLLIDFQLQAPALHGDSHEKWVKETRLDISAGSRAEDNGPQENPRRPNCQEVETNRRRHAPKSVQYGIVTRLALTREALGFSCNEALPRAGLLFNSCLCTSVWRASARQLASFLYSRSLPPRLQFLMTVPALPATIIKVINGRRVSVQQQQAGSAVFMWIDCAMAPAESLTPGGIPMPPTTSTVPPFETVTPLTAPPDELSLV